MTRWVLTVLGVSLRLHHWHRSDDKRAPHDHPYWLLTLVLWGRYTDVAFPRPTLSVATRDELRPGSMRFRRPEHTHWVDVAPGGCWTLVLTGRQRRVWGFWTERYNGARRFVRSSRYFRQHGHHPCDQP